MTDLNSILHWLTVNAKHWFGTDDWTVIAAQLGSALAAGLLVYFGFSALKRQVQLRFEKRARRRSPPNHFLLTVSTMAARTTRAFIILGALTVALAFLPITGQQFELIHRIFDVATILQIAIWASVAFTEWLGTLRGSGGSMADYRALSNAHAIIGTIAKILLWSIAAMLIFDKLGFNVTALVTGLGIGGIAIGLAVQKILADLFASLAIVLDQPFEYGDFIIAGPQMGTVEQIGLKTTRLRAPTGEQIVISNSDLLESRIQNFKRMVRRRVIFQMGLVNGTDPGKLSLFPKIIADIVRAQPEVTFERCHLVAFADVSIRFEISYLVATSDNNIYLDRQQAILLEIYKRCQQETIQIAMGLPVGFPAFAAAASPPAKLPPAPNEKTLIA